MINYFDFKGKKYIITGASSGIGRAVAIEISKRNGSVVLLGRNEETLNTTLNLMKLGEHSVRQVDLSTDNNAALTDIFDDTISSGVKISGVVHCAGIAPIIPIQALDKKQFEECMAVNFYSFVELVRLLSKKKYRADSVSIVGISSINSIYPDKCQSIYSASKAAMNAAIQAFALELSSKNIRINAVVPGSVNTDMAKAAFEQMGEENMKKKLGRQILGISEPEQIAKMVLFLLSDLSEVMTGRLLYADGGYINF